MTSIKQDGNADGALFSQAYWDMKEYDSRNTEPAHEEDLLDEFLDRRVYDSFAGPGLSKHNLNFSDYNPYDKNMTEESNFNKEEEMDEKDKYEKGVLNPVNYQEIPREYLYVEPGRELAMQNYDIFSSPESVNNNEIADNRSFSYGNDRQLLDFENIRHELSKVKFGSSSPKTYPDFIEIPDPSYLDFSAQAMQKLPYQMTVTNLPACSRVETQIKVMLSINPSPEHQLLHVPRDMVSKSKFCLDQSVDELPPLVKKNLLYLDAYVLTSDLQHCCNVCSRCIKREQKRASRRKNANNDNGGEPSSDKNSTSKNVRSNSVFWEDENMIKKAVIFNCKEIVSFPPPNGLDDKTAKQLELSLRIICYCRHHQETEGFRILFIVKNNSGDLVSKLLTSPIMIMDRKKTYVSTKDRADDSSYSMTKPLTYQQPVHISRNQLLDLDEKLNGGTHILSPKSMDDSLSEAQTNTESNDLKNIKRKKVSANESSNSQPVSVVNDVLSGFSSISNSDTNTSAPLSVKQADNNSAFMIQEQPSTLLDFSAIPGNTFLTLQPRIPTIQRIIPAQGSIRGGIEVTLLGFNFRQGLSVKFGLNQALATHCWSESTILTYLPPAAMPGQVLVSFENERNNATIGGPQQQQVFTYTDDTDRQLIELALQIVGLKMNGKLEDAKNIAKRIVGTDSSREDYDSSSSVKAESGYGQTLYMRQENIEWLNNARKAVERLTKSDLCIEEMLVNLLSMVDLPNCPIIIPNWQLCNSEGQTLLHLSTLKNYKLLINFLITHGCKVDIKDHQGVTPLFLASLCGYRNLIRIFLECKCNWKAKLPNERMLTDYCDMNVLDIFQGLEHRDIESPGDFTDDAQVSNSASFDSLNTILSVNYGRHISRMVIDNCVSNPSNSGLSSPDMLSSAVQQSEYEKLEDSSEMADSEYESHGELEFGEPNDLGGIKHDDSIKKSLPKEDLNNSLETPNDQPRGIWEKVKNVFNHDDDNILPSYEDLFPFGPSLSKFNYFGKQTESSHFRADALDPANASSTNDEGACSDSSEDMVVSFERKPEKSVWNDKMLLFFWGPLLFGIIGSFFFINIMGYRFEFIEVCKHHFRTMVGNLLIGNERLSKLFQSTGLGNNVISATRGDE